MKLVSLLLTALLAAPAAAQSLWPENWKPIAVNSWGGLNLLQDSSMIGGDAQVALNVLTDNSFLEKRPGNTRLATILAGSPVLYVNDWASPNGSRYLVAQASNTIYQTNFSGVPIALSTVATGFNITTVPAYSKLEFADGFRPLWYWNGNSTATVTDGVSGAAAPTCTYIDFKDLRIWCANLPNGFTAPGNTTNGGGSSTVLISSAGGDGYWAVPSDVAQVDSAPNRFDFNPDDGDQITCLAKTPWGEFVGKRNSSYIVKGNGNLSYDPRLLDPKIGCVDNRSVKMVYGVLKWLAVDGVYGYDGSGPPHLLTRELDPLMALVRESSFSQGQWATQLQSDWATGTESPTTGNLSALPWDYSTIAGQIFPSSGTLYDDNTSPNLQTCSTHLNPDNGLPWSCGVGFSSDTLVNIDTTSVPLSIGYAQVYPSSAGVQVWGSTFPLGNFTNTITTWTAGSVIRSGAACTSFGYPFPGSNYICSAGNGVGAMYTSANLLDSPPSNKGWNFGSWSIKWTSALEVGVSWSYGQCFSSFGSECLEYDFITDSGYSANNTVTPSFNGYGYTISQNSCSGSNCINNLVLFKSIGSVRTTLGSGTFPSNYSTVSVNSIGYSTITVSRTPGGYFSVSVGTTTIFSSFDNTASATQSNYSNLILHSQLGGGTFSGQGIYGAELDGYGSGSIVSRIIDTGSVAPLAGVLSSSYTLQGVTTGAFPETEIDFYVRSSTSPNNDQWSAWTASSNSVLAVLPRRYWQYEALFTSRIASATVQLASVELDAVTTGYYYSKVNFVGNLITSWRQFGVTEDNPGTYNYAVRQATYNFSPSNVSTPAWTAQTANVNVNLGVSTPTYAQFRLDSTSLTSNPSGASAAEPITAVFLRWDQGANLPVASATLDRRYMLCFTVSTSAVAPDTCLLHQKTGKWVSWSNGGTIGAMGLYNNQMVAADGGTSSYVWQIMQPNVYEDDGAAISASWVGADFTDGLPFNNKDYYGAVIDALPVQTSSVTFSYQVNKSSGFVDTQFSTDDGQPLNAALPVLGSQYGAVNQWVPPPTGYDIGKYIRLQFSDGTLDNYFRINSLIFFVKDEPFSHP